MTHSRVRETKTKIYMAGLKGTNPVS